VNRPSGVPGELLEDDRPDERAKRPIGIARPVLDRANERDEVRQDGIASCDIIDGSLERDPGHASITPISHQKNAGLLPSAWAVDSASPDISMLATFAMTAFRNLRRFYGDAAARGWAIVTCLV
jgi:hypothetical protein